MKQQSNNEIEKETELKEEIEQGVWIVYDLEANRKIQELLINESFKFRFDSSLGIIKKQATQEIIKIIKKIIPKNGEETRAICFILQKLQSQNKEKNATKIN